MTAQLTSDRELECDMYGVRAVHLVSGSTDRSFRLFLSVSAHAVLDVVIDDEVKLFLRKSIVPGKHMVDLIDCGLRLIRIELVVRNLCSVLCVDHLSGRVRRQVFYQLVI